MARSSTVFEDIITKGMRAGVVPARTKAAREWYREVSRGSGKVSANLLMKSDRKRLRSKPEVGSMFLFMYDPKTKEKLPYYDRTPLIFCVGDAPGGFYGINMHYLPLRYRAKLMDGLYEIANNQRYDDRTKLEISYQLLKSSAKLRYFKPCFKHYLWSHARSRFYYVYPSEWDISLFLPTQNFSKRTAHRVHADSVRQLRG